LTYKQKCLDEFKQYLDKHLNLDKAFKDFALEIFSIAFDYGSLNGASEEIQNYAIQNINPKRKDIKELIQQIRIKP
jgi:hypothetical protein